MCIYYSLMSFITCDNEFLSYFGYKTTDMFLGQFFWTWNQQPWMQSDPDRTGNSSVQIILFSDIPVQETTGQKVTIRRVQSQSTLFWMCYGGRRRPVTVYRASRWPTVWGEGLGQGWGPSLSVKLKRNIRTESWQPSQCSPPLR